MFRSGTNRTVVLSIVVLLTLPTHSYAQRALGGPAARAAARAFAVIIGGIHVFTSESYASARNYLQGLPASQRERAQIREIRKEEPSRRRLEPAPSSSDDDDDDDK